MRSFCFDSKDYLDSYNVENDNYFLFSLRLMNVFIEIVLGMWGFFNGK